MKKTCYRCNKIATSKEHIPPRNLFPEKELAGKDYKINLITVPSCDEHNQDKSDDDEHFLMSITPFVLNNNIGNLYHDSKVKAILERKFKKYNNEVLKNKKITIVKIDDVITPVFIGEPDTERLSKSIESICYGLYYFETGKVFTGKFKVILGFTFSDNEIANDYFSYFRKVILERFKLIPEKGSNPEIFKYQIVNDDFFSFKLTFYEGADVFVAMYEEKDEELINDHVRFIEYQGLLALREFAFDSDHSARLLKLNSYLESHPPSTFFYALRGESFNRLGNYEDSIKDYIKATELDPNNFTAFNNLGMVYQRVEKFELARKSFEQAIALNKEFSVARLNLGSILSYHFKDEFGAKIQYETILEYDPKNPKAHNNLATCIERLKPDNYIFKAEYHFKKAIEYDPSCIEAILNHASHLASNGKLNRAMKLFKKAKSLNPNEDFRKVVDEVFVKVAKMNFEYFINNSTIN